MLNKNDQESVVKGSQTANLLVSDLRAMVQSENILLSDIALEMLEQAVRIEQRLKRIASTTEKNKKKR